MRGDKLRGINDNVLLITISFNLNLHCIILIIPYELIHQTRILYPAKVSFRHEGETKAFSDEGKLKESTANKCVLKEMLKEVFQTKGI